MHNSITKRLITSFLTATLWSIPLYTLYLGINSTLINTIIALFAIYILLISTSAVWFFTGMFIGLFWFWWIGLSFIHYQMPWMIIPVDTAVAITYALLFYFGAWLGEYIEKISKIDTANIIIKALYLYFVSYIHPFGFDWFRPQILFGLSYFGVSNLDFFIIVSSLALIAILSKKNIKYRYLPLLLMIFAVDMKLPHISYRQNDGIYLANTNVPIEKKWNQRYLKTQLKDVFAQIDEAIDRGYKAIILPESVIPLFLNRQPVLMDMLKSRSKKRAIIIGSLYLDGKIHRNSAYIFQNGKYKVANKTVLVPFGESNPLPKWLSGIVNKIFFDGAPDYQAAKNPTDINIKTQRYRVAICYEGTSEKLYNSDIKNMIVISNNAWFTPSIEPTLQKLLMIYLSRKYRVNIFHSVNGSKSFKIDINSNKFQ